VQRSKGRVASATASAVMVVVCPLCSSFAAKDFKGVLRHMGVTHSHEAGFYVRCCVEDCPRTYSNFHSYKKHLYTKHRDVLGVADSESAPTDCSSDIDDFLNDEESPENPVDSCQGKERAAALFILKAKHIHKVPQSALLEIMQDFKMMLESTFHYVQRNVMEVLSNLCDDPSLETCLSEIFNSQELRDPFCGLESQHMQKAIFAKQFNILVCWGWGEQWAMLY